MIVIELQGGLGNQMFQYALGRHLSLINNTNLYLDTSFLNDRKPKKNFTLRTFDLDIFNITAGIAPAKISKKYGINKNIFTKVVNRIIQPKSLSFIPEKKFSFNPAILNLTDNVYLNGYWQSEKYFIAIQEIIRKDFSIKEPLPKHIQNLHSSIENSNAVCIHVRRGDFVKVETHGTLGMDYYGKAAELMCEKITNPVFYIFSDDINWCKKNIILPGNINYVSDEFAAEKSRGHLALMMACKYFIIPNSSYGWWAAWLNIHPDKIVIAPKVWFHNSTWDTKDILPLNWITL